VVAEKELAEKIVQGDRLALARAITLVENRVPGHEIVLAECFRNRKSAARIGITGAPGSGKSTLVNALIKLLRGEGKTVGVIAVDPTSPFTGGALLGDRVRMISPVQDPGVFIRSMASRGALGGLSWATDDVAVLFEASGKDYVLIETVGVGQSEVAIAASAETTVLILTPEGGDSVQTLKAGLMEIADVFAINKADRPGADRIVLDIRSTLEMRSRHGEDWRPEIVCTSATTGDGVDKLLEAIRNHRAHLTAHGTADERERLYLEKKLRSETERHARGELWDSFTDDEISELVNQIAAGKTTPYKAARELLDRFIAGR
jgi:LAO/AO transport system kinase